jgi:molybdopterin converting factor small subunit
LAVSVRGTLSRWLGAGPRDRIQVHILIKGRIGAGWHDVDRTLAVPTGTTLGELIEIAQRDGVPLRDAIENSPHLRHTLMWNGDRCPVDDNASRSLADGDTIYLLAPVAGG